MNNFDISVALDPEFGISEDELIGEICITQLAGAKIIRLENTYVEEWLDQIHYCLENKIRKVEIMSDNIVLQFEFFESEVSLFYEAEIITADYSIWMNLLKREANTLILIVEGTSGPVQNSVLLRIKHWAR